MSLLIDIQNDAVDSKSDVASLLRKCKLLAARLNSRPLEQWLHWESNGYLRETPVPTYREWPLVWQGHFVNRYGGTQLSGYDIPTIRLPDPSMAQFECRDSVAAIQSMLDSFDDSHQLRVPNADLAVCLTDKVFADMVCLEAWGTFDATRLVSALNSVRERVLDFALAIWKEEPTAGEIGGTTKKVAEQKVSQIFNTTIIGGGANIAGSVEGSTLTVTVNAGDFQSLQSQLKSAGISDDDVHELRNALVEEPKPNASDEYGPRVRAWILKMLSKAVEKSWPVALGRAGELLTTAIARYYGLS